MKTATAKKQKQTALDDEPTLQLTLDQFRRLQQVWYAFAELADMIDAPDNDGGGMECLKIVNDQGLGRVIGELQAQVDKRKWLHSFRQYTELNRGRAPARLVELAQTRKLKKKTQS